MLLARLPPCASPSVPSTFNTHLPCPRTFLPLPTVDSVEEDHNGDILLWRYMLGLLQQDLRARLQASRAAAGEGGPCSSNCEGL